LRRALRIAVTSGDPAGIGPEVALNAFIYNPYPDIVPVLIGNRGYYHSHYKNFIAGMNIADFDPEDDASVPGTILFHDVTSGNRLPPPGRGGPETGLESRLYIDTAVDLWKKKLVDAIVTGPVSKSLIEKSGTPFTGHTEYMAGLIGEKDPLMMMFSEKYRVLLVTTHIPVAAIAGNINLERLLYVIRTGRHSLRMIDGVEPALAITGLDPHCGDDGAIGSFDREVTSAAVKAARIDGITIEGPFAADTLFIPHNWRRYGLIVAHYHDQGLIPFKQLSFDTGVNVTLGLSLVRTSVDHGTAFDIAGKGRADSGSMVQAIALAGRLARKA